MVFSLTVLPSPASFQIQATSSTLSLQAGAITFNTDTIIISSFLGFTGTINLACSVAYQGSGTPTAAPTCSFNQSSIPVSLGMAIPNPILTIGTTAPQAVSGSASSASSAFGAPQIRPGSTHNALSITLSLASFLLLVAPVSVSRRLRGTLLALLVVPGLVLISGCGGGGATSTPQPPPQPGTSTGSYTVTVTATTTAAGTPAAAPVTIALTVK